MDPCRSVLASCFSGNTPHRANPLDFLLIPKHSDTLLQSRIYALGVSWPESATVIGSSVAGPAEESSTEADIDADLETEPHPSARYRIPGGRNTDSNTPDTAEVPLPPPSTNGHFLHDADRSEPGMQRRRPWRYLRSLCCQCSRLLLADSECTPTGFSARPVDNDPIPLYDAPQERRFTCRLADDRARRSDMLDDVMPVDDNRRQTERERYETE